MQADDCHTAYLLAWSQCEGIVTCSKAWCQIHATCSLLVDYPRSIPGLIRLKVKLTSRTTQALTTQIPTIYSLVTTAAITTIAH